MVPYVVVCGVLRSMHRDRLRYLQANIKVKTGSSLPKPVLHTPWPLTCFLAILAPSLVTRAMSRLQTAPPKARR